MERQDSINRLFAKEQVMTHVPQKSHYIQLPCCEQTIIDIQELFVTPGIHHIEIKNAEKGRTLIESLLASLNCYNAIASITTRKAVFTSDIYDCSHDLAIQQCIESFFVEQFFFDFMLVELSGTLSSKSWYKNAEQYLYTSTISMHAPIVFVEYK